MASLRLPDDQPSGAATEMLGHRRHDPIQRGPPPQRFHLGNLRVRPPAVKEAAHAHRKGLRAYQETAEGVLPRRIGGILHARLHKATVTTACLDPKAAELSQHAIVGYPAQRSLGASVTRITAPFPLLGPGDQPGANRVQVNVTADLGEVALLFDQVRLNLPWKRCPTRRWRTLKYPV